MNTLICKSLIIKWLFVMMLISRTTCGAPQYANFSMLESAATLNHL